MDERGPRLPLVDSAVPPIAPVLGEAMTAFAAAAMRARRVDPVTTELVRLRCAGYHDCRLCGSLRLQEATLAGVDEEMAAKVAHHESSDLPVSVKVALRLADAVIIDPRAASSELSRDLHAHFSDAQIAELLFDIMKWSRQKELVALRLERPRWSGLGVLAFDEAGDAVIGAGAAVAAEPALS